MKTRLAKTRTRENHSCCSLSWANKQTHETRCKTEFGNISPTRNVKGINAQFSVITKLILLIIKKARQGGWTKKIKQQKQPKGILPELCPLQHIYCYSAKFLDNWSQVFHFSDIFHKQDLKRDGKCRLSVQDGGF